MRIRWTPPLQRICRISAITSKSITAHYRQVTMRKLNETVHSLKQSLHRGPARMRRKHPRDSLWALALCRYLSCGADHRSLADLSRCTRPNLMFLATGLLLQAEQVGFRVQSAGEASEFSGRSNDAMARQDDGYRISSVRGTDSSCRPRVAELFRELSVAPRFSKRYGQQGFPDIFLKTSTPQIERDGKRFSFPGEIFCQLPFRLNKNGMLLVLNQFAQTHPAWTVFFPKNGHLG